MTSILNPPKVPPIKYPVISPPAVEVSRAKSMVSYTRADGMRPTQQSHRVAKEGKFCHQLAAGRSTDCILLNNPTNPKIV